MEQPNTDATDEAMKGIFHPYPEWRAAMEKIIESEFPYGHVLTKGWLCEAFGIPMPDATHLADEREHRQLRFLSCFKRLEDALLKEHCLALRCKTGVGHEIVHPAEQAGWSMDSWHGERSKADRRARSRLAGVRVQELSADERRQLVDAQSILAKASSTKPKPKEWRVADQRPDDKRSALLIGTS